MTISVYLSAVNQKLLFARRLLQVAQKAGSLDRHAEIAVAQSVAFQLRQAWHWHLKDIAATYQLSDPEQVADADALLNQLTNAGKSPAEAYELVNLIQNPDSWAGSLSGAAAELQSLPTLRKAQMDADRLPALTLNKGDQGVNWTLETAQSWLEGMQELVDRQREVMIEF